MNPSDYEEMKNACKHREASKLYQYVQSVAWMSLSISYFAERSTVFYSLLESAYKETGKRTKRTIANIGLRMLVRKGTHATVFRGSQERISKAVKLFRRDRALRLVCAVTPATRIGHSLSRSAQRKKRENRRRANITSLRVSQLTVQWCIGALVDV